MDVASEEKRFYIIVPETIQTLAHSQDMESGRLMAQNFHLGRVVERRRMEAEKQYEDVAAIVLSVRNSLELIKVLNDLEILRDKTAGGWLEQFPIDLYKDLNPVVYQVPGRVMSIVCVGPIEKSLVHPAIGHLELY